MIFDATRHTLTPGAANNRYPPSVDSQYREWINELLHIPGKHPNPVQQLVISAYEHSQLSRLLPDRGRELQRLPIGSFLLQGYGLRWHSLEIHWQDE